MSQQPSRKKPSGLGTKAPLIGLIISCISVAGYALFIEEDEAKASKQANAEPVIAPEVISPPPTTAPRDNASKGERFTGNIKEVISVSSYSYLRMATASGDKWVAVLKEDFTPGQTIDFAVNLVMRNFASKELNRTFDLIYFGQRQGKRSGNAESSAKDSPIPAPATTVEEPTATLSTGLTEPLERVPGPQGKSVAEIFSQKASLVGTEVQVRGEVQKLTEGVMGTNFLHIQDGSGTPEKKNHDIVVLVKENPPAIGTRATFSATVKLNVDYGSGYSFPLLLDEGKVVALE